MVQNTHFNFFLNAHKKLLKSLYSWKGWPEVEGFEDKRLLEFSFEE